jgi:hypothetical protein
LKKLQKKIIPNNSEQNEYFKRENDIISANKLKNEDNDKVLCEKISTNSSDLNLNHNNLTEIKILLPDKSICTFDIDSNSKTDETYHVI